MAAIVENPDKKALNNKEIEVIGREFEIEVGEGIDANGGAISVEEPAVEEPAVEEPAVEEPAVENMEICAAAVIEVQGKEVMVFNRSLMIHAMNQDVKEKLHITRTNAFVDK